MPASDNLKQTYAIHLCLDEYRGLNGDWTILVPFEAAGGVRARFFGLELQTGHAAGFPVGRLRARHLGSARACKYELVTDATILTEREHTELEEQARALLQHEVTEFRRELNRLGV